MNDIFANKYKIEFYDDDGNSIFYIYIDNLECLAMEIKNRIYDFPRFDKIIVTYVGDIKI